MTTPVLITPPTPPTILFTYTDGSKLYSVSAKWLTAMPVWEGNRVMDEAHVSTLEAAITNPREIQGPFSVVTYTDEETRATINRIIDGQHRKEVLRRYLEHNPSDSDFQILVRRYTIPNHDAAIALFRQINTVKPMVYRGSSTERLHDIVTALKRHFIGERGKTVIALIRPGCNRPFLSTEHLEASLKLYGIHENIDISVADIVKHAEEMNGFYAEDISRIPARYTQITLDRAIEYGFYLGLDPKCSWLLSLRKK